MESFNEWTVLMTGYHLVLISGFEIEFRIRNEVGTSLICFLVVMILLNFVLLLFNMVQTLVFLCRKAYYRRS